MACIAILKNENTECLAFHLPVLTLAMALAGQAEIIPSISSGSQIPINLSVAPVATSLKQIPTRPGSGAPAVVALADSAGPAIPPIPDQDTTTRLQIFLDEHSFGPGKIDGRWSEFVEKALKRFQTANGQQPSGKIDPALQDELQGISPIYTTYMVTTG